MIETPYLLFLGDAPDQLAAKVAQGIKDWRPEYAVGQLRLEGCKADMGVPDMTLAEAKAAGVKTLVIGVANRGGVISQSWKKVLVEALEEGFDLASGLHNLLRDEEDLAAVARATGRTLHDVRIPSVKYPIANGVKRTGKRMLAVGTDCSVGKMYTALCMEREMRARGMKATFRATGQTGILITGGGVPLDAVIADFMAGSIEYLTPDNDADHWDLIEGQGSLYHVSYSGVTLALVHGGQPDALVLCHEPTRPHMRGLPGYQLPSIEAVRDTALALARVANPACVAVGVSVNTQHMADAEARAYLAEVEARLGLPATDPFRYGAAKLVGDFVGAWTKVYSGTNLAVYRSTDPQSNGHYLRVDDTGTTSARVRGYEEMTDVNTGTGPFCTDTQMSGGGYWWKSASANTNASKWKLFGDSRFFGVAVAAASSSSTVNIAAPAKGFGDALALAPGGDAWNTVLSANGNNSSNSALYGALDNSSVSATLGFVVSPRSWTGLGSAVLLNSLPYIGATTAVSGADATLGIVPSEIDGRIKPTRRFLSEQGTNKPPRSEIPGVMSIPQTGALSILNDGDMLAGADDLAGRQLMCVATGFSYTNAPTGIYLVDITGPWRS